ncbi:MAG: Protein TolB [candidate division TM6 bacterium GW2011_GWF2_43_17]|nr:MAG: Protein TolB [candidate division TM6 bacterium GW2011_GWF2_43_17]HAU30487.1 hypothetical protein [Candidatus Dependentiae bacterium]
MRYGVTGCFFALLMIFFGGSACAQNAVPKSFVVGISNQDAIAGPMRLYIGVIALAATAHKEVEVFLEDLRQKFSLEDRFLVTAELRSSLPKKRKQIQDLFVAGYDAALFVTFYGSGKTIDWRLYETDAGSMVHGRKVACSTLADATAHIAVRVIEELTTCRMPFLTHIAFVERKSECSGSIIRLASFDGRRQNILFDSSRILVSPVWGSSKDTVFIAVSEFTPRNVRFIGIDMQGRRYRLLDEDGTSVGLCYATDSQEVVYCKSGHIWRLRFNPSRQLWEHRRIVEISGTCGSPSLRKNGDIIYCSNGKICAFLAAEKKERVYTPQGYHVAPSYSAAKDAVVFASKIGGQIQLQSLNLGTGALEQLTFGSGDKTDPTWSPCGRYCAYCLQGKGESSIWVLNTETKVTWRISPPQIFAQFPSWSPYCTTLELR